MFSRAGLPLTTHKIPSLAYQFVQNNNIKGFSKHANSTGKKWMCHFLCRHKEIRIKKAHNLSVNHAMCTNPAVFNQFFKQYEAELKCLNIQSLQQIWNCDESGCQDVPKEHDVVGETGVEACTIVGKEQGETSTVLAFANAIVQVCPPVIVHKGKRVQESWLQNK